MRNAVHGGARVADFCEGAVSGYAGSDFKSFADYDWDSFHTEHVPPERIAAIGQAIGVEHRPLNPAATHTYPGITMPAVVTAAAACNHMWISCPNSSSQESCWPAFFVRADGVTTARLRRNVPGVLVSTVDTEQALYDSTGPWRDRAMNGVLHSGDLVGDPRSRDGQSL